MKTLVKLQNKDKNISHIEFSIISSNEVIQQSHVQVCNNNIYDENKNPAENGLMDPKMGILEKNKKCSVCHELSNVCMGHFGYLNLSNYIFPISFLKEIIKILKCICKSCGSILLTVSDLKRFDKSLKKKEMTYITKKSIRKEIVAICSKTRICRYCCASNGNVKKVTALSMIYHKKYILKDPLKIYKERFENLDSDLQSLINDGIELLRPYFVYNLFKRVPSKHHKYLGVRPGTKLCDLVFKSLVVPPNCLRPSTLTNDANTSREDDITIILRTLLSDMKLPAVHNEYASLIKPSAANLRLKEKKTTRGMQQRLAGKKGRFRNNLMGKRTNFTCRTVISPDPYLRIDQVSIPLFCAMKLTFTEKVTSFNMEHLKKLILNGPYKHPGAMAYARQNSTDAQMAMSHMKLVNTNIEWKSLRNADYRANLAKNLRIGDLVERHIDDGDVVLFNRQPSLHRLSFQAFSVVVKKERTLSFNPCCCNPFNADFDGDEMNIHFPQTYEAKAECLTLISSIKNIGSPNRGEPATAPLQDILTAAYLLTSKDSFYTKAQFLHLAMQIFKDLIPTKEFYIPKPAIMKPVALYTGKQLLNLIISPYRSISKETAAVVPEARLNLITGNKIYKTGEDLTPDDSFVMIHNSDLMMGQLDKSLLGGGSKNSMFYRMLRDVSDAASCRSMEWLCKVVLTDLKYRGFSIGIKDVSPNRNLKKLKANLIKKNFEDCEGYIRSYENKTLACDPGCSLEETLESKISSKLSNIRDDGGKACKEELHPRNAPLIMAMCGSKGSHINISQMVFCVGQQIINNKRIPNVPGTDRTLLFCPKNCRSPNSRGFVGNSFYSGLNPMEFVFHAMSGREGLIDTAVKTAETGYMQRRLIKCLEDLTVQFDNTVRDFRGSLFQFNYGCDGFDPSKLEDNNVPCNFVHEFYHALQDDSKHSESLTDEATAMSELDKYLATLEDRFEVQESTEIGAPLIGLKTRLREHLRMHFKCKIGIQFEVTAARLRLFVDNCFRKFRLALIEPGTAVGVICGQSIGEPATQMTLKTFHFAGVASMNITQGVPRMQEIINGSENIKTPIVSVHPLDAESQDAVRLIQRHIQPIFLRDLIEKSYVVLSTTGKYLEIELNGNLVLKDLLIRQDVMCAALDRVKLVGIIIDVIYKDNAQVFIRCQGDRDFCCQMVLEVLEKVQVAGIKNVLRTVIQRSEQRTHTVFMEGGSLLSAMQVPGVDTFRTQSNNIIEIMKVLGIEAAKNSIINEFNAVMAAHSLFTDLRHMMLLADTMCYTGQVLGYQRSGMAKSKNSILCLASFESTLDHLFEAAYHQQKDEVNGVSDCLTFGKTMPLGTGLSTLIWNTDKTVKTTVCRKRKFLDTQ